MSANGSDLERFARLYAENHLAIAWTAANAGAEAKRVRTRDWQHTKPLADPDFARGLFKRCEKRNPAIVVRPSGLVSLECDGANELREIEQLALPPTVTVRSSAPEKRHYHYHAPATELPFVAFRFESGTVSADAERYFLAPPARHPTGSHYAFLPGLAPDEIGFTDLPEEAYRELLSRARTEMRELDERVAAGGKFTHGARGRAVFRYACQQRRWYAEDLGAILDAATRFNELRCEPPIEQERVVEQVKGAMRKQGGQEQPDTGLELVSLLEISMRSIEWLEKPLWQRSAFQLLAGPKGSGKGTYLAGLASRISHAGKAVIFISSEDSAEIDLKPRLVAAGAALERCAVIRQHVRLPDDVEQLHELGSGFGDLGLLVIDPVANHIGQRNANNDAEVRDAIAPLNKLADELDCLLIGVRHPGKDRSRGAVASILGSTAWVDTPRAVVMLASDDEDPLVRHIQVVAGNRSLNGAAQAFRIEAAEVEGLSEPVTLALALGESAKSVDELLSAKRKDSRTDQARALILDILEGEGEQESDALDARVAKATGLNARTVQNARTALRNEGLIKTFPEKDELGSVQRWIVSRSQAPRDGELWEGV